MICGKIGRQVEEECGQAVPFVVVAVVVKGESVRPGQSSKAFDVCDNWCLAQARLIFVDGDQAKSQSIATSCKMCG